MDVDPSAPVASMRKPARGFPSRRPGVHPVSAKLMPPAARRPPTCLLSAVGRVTKKGPFARPLKMEKTRRIVNVDETDHTANMVMALTDMVNSSILMAPSLSQAVPDVRRRMVMHALKQATGRALLLGAIEV